MAFSQADLDAVERAIATGTLSLEVEGKRVAYRSIAELKEARATIRDALGPSPGVQLVRPAFRRGM